MSAKTKITFVSGASVIAHTNIKDVHAKLSHEGASNFRLFKIGFKDEEVAYINKNHVELLKPINY